MRKNKRKIVNPIFAMVLIMSIFVISILIQANSTNENIDGVGNISLAEGVSLASKSDAGMVDDIKDEAIKIDSDEDIKGDENPATSSDVAKPEDMMKERTGELEDIAEDEFMAFAMFGEDRASGKDYSSNVDWSEKTKAYIGDSTRERNKAKDMFDIEKDIDYEKREIHWIVSISSNGENWYNLGPTRPQNTEVYLFIPRHEGNLSITRIDQNGNAKIMGFNNVSQNKLIDKGNGDTVKDESTDFYKWFKRVQEDADTINSNKGIYEVLSDLNWWADSGRLVAAYQDNAVDIYNRKTVRYEFTTRHSETEDLEKVPLGVHIKTFSNAWRRYLFTGIFGRAGRHEFQIPDIPIDVEDKEHLTPEEKEEVKQAILKKTLDYYDAFKAIYTREGDELRDAISQNRIVIGDRGELSVVWEDGTQSALRDVNKYIRQKDHNPPEITITPEEPSSLDTEDIPKITIDVADKEGNLYDFNIEGLPNGLSIKKDKNNEYGNMEITGKVEGIAWQDGEMEKDFPLKVVASDSWNNSSEKEFVLKIIRDISLVPVGTNESGYKLPLIFVGFSLLFGVLAILNLKREENFDV